MAENWIRLPIRALESPSVETFNTWMESVLSSLLQLTPL